MTFVDKFRGRWARRFTVAALATVLLPGIIGFAGGSATAGAFSRPGLPVEYLMVPSASMGRDIATALGDEVPVFLTIMNGGLIFGGGLSVWAGHRIEIGPVVRITLMGADEDADPASVVMAGVRIGLRK